MATLIINGVDFSDCIQNQNEISETPIYVNGPNTGTNILGSPIFDRVATRYRNSYAMKPLPRNRFEQLLKAVSPSRVSFIISTARDRDATTGYGQISISQYSYGMDFDGERIYYGGRITVEAEVFDE